MADIIEALRAALDFQQRGNYAEATRLFQYVLACDERHADALHLLGLCLHAQGDSAGGLKQIEKAIAVKPFEPMFHTNAGVVAVAAGDVKAGMAHYHDAIEIDPAYVDAYNNLGVVLQKLGMLKEAEITLRRAIELQPSLVSAFVNLGNVYQALDRLDKAVKQYKRAIELAPDLAKAHNNLGNALRLLRSYTEALESYDRALALNSDYSEAHCSKALIYASRGETEAAVESVERAIAICPDASYRLLSSSILPIIPRSRSDMQRWRDRFVEGIAGLLAEGLRVDGSPVAAPMMNFYLAYHGENDRDVMVLLSQFYRQAFPSLQWTAPQCDGREAGARGRRICLGLFSSYLRNPAVVWTICGLLGQLPKDRFEIVLFGGHWSGPEIMSEIRATADKVIQLPRSLNQAREAIAREQVDVLIFADIGLEGLSYSLAHARLAPTQIATWGHPVTTGIPTIDYYISSDMAEPKDADSHYSERLVRLAGVQTYYRRPEIASDPGMPAVPDLPANATIYLCAQSLFKIHPDMDQPLSEILRRDPAGFLLIYEGLHPAVADRLRERWSVPFEGVMDRVRIMPRVSVQRFLENLASADVLLDTWPYGSGNTSYQGFAAGVPIVTLLGRFLRGRGVFAHYRHMGLTDCVADSPEQYVEIAVRLGTDPDFHGRIAALIRERCHVLFDDEEVGRDLVRFLLEVTA
jgi:predicted O-linked N-acetylglucosamine transferase (SPINDLY family)